MLDGKYRADPDKIMSNIVQVPHGRKDNKPLFSAWGQHGPRLWMSDHTFSRYAKTRRMVTCPICREQFKSLMSHVRYKHGLTSVSFHEMYPNVSMVSEETRKRTSTTCKASEVGSWRKGQKISVQGRKNISKAMKGEKNHFHGRKHTAKTRQRMQENHADFTGDNNPFRRAVERNPALRRKASERALAYWRGLRSDPDRYEALMERMSKSMAQAHAEGRLRGYGKGHEHGWFNDPRNGNKLYYRSSYERRFLEWCVVQDKEVERCPFIVPYTDGKGHNRHYIPDYLVDGNSVIEIKPEKMLGWRENPNKIAAGRAFCEKRGLLFHVVTEVFLNDPGSELPLPT